MIKCGIDIGGTGVKFGIFDNEKLIKDFSIKTPKIKEEFTKLVAQAIKENYDYKKIEKYVIAIPGAVKNDTVIHAPNTNIVGINLKKDLSLLLENQNFIIENDANLAALAEARFTKTKNLLLLTLGTRIGGGIIIDDKIYSMNGFGGEVGHMKIDFSPNARLCGCGKRGCAETYGSAGGLVKSYNERHNTNFSAKELVDLARAGDKEALDELNLYGKRLGLLVANITQVLDIDDIRFAGGVSLAFDLFKDSLIKAYKENVITPVENYSISQAKLKNSAGIFSAAYL